MRKYHLSYDIIDTKDSTQYKEDKEYLLYLLYSLGYNSIYSYADSTIIVEYDEDKITQTKLFDFLENNVQHNVRYYISLISQIQDKPIDSFYNEKYFNFLQRERNTEFQKELINIDWDYLKKLYGDSLEY
ncbi:hypothetical protein A0O34_16790 [Chryseobacterium glaciei]|uniref:Uncharacterized protein n=1 Tax=Chryseobacterium glaciei TaxID=1685010 RepID=A0A172XQL4_9FLAO|nr:hypothetical protein [Chryseobacterium glaciei]ANF49313.1 hypothetical protein A0O34_01525 [Chryseobacterium glaciei]ANF52070.1 hypothetical protein A0O34_16790 [Chryseobacterium glaciei]